MTPLFRTFGDPLPLSLARENHFFLIIFGSLFWKSPKMDHFLGPSPVEFSPWNSFFLIIFGPFSGLVRIQKWTTFGTIFCRVSPVKPKFWWPEIWRLSEKCWRPYFTYFSDRDDFWGPTTSLNRALGSFLYTISPCGTTRLHLEKVMSRSDYLNRWIIMTIWIWFWNLPNFQKCTISGSLLHRFSPVSVRFSGSILEPFQTSPKTVDGQTPDITKIWGP